MDRIRQLDWIWLGVGSRRSNGLIPNIFLPGEFRVDTPASVKNRVDRAWTFDFEV